ncbi:peptidoglycan DD-metalloendopeptidase family protein [Winogradskyella eckloniae]|uniref:peptidoglycan DD-metalloendopeptidase family protein n=1 Tax=Winogradskyella eckloniae TaxID=1089306 RepID=UPI00156519A7|nr:peptidoglycan DD-metalloendopeptidase family protein [Winogradskyella eckloniae]NRD19894.1 peptidoglycan DD-metalloendopeptidase family protein [Winogradskyella eckloniae]
MPFSSFEIFLKSLNAHAVIQTLRDSQDCVSLDLSIDNPKLKQVNLASATDLEAYITAHIKVHKAQLAYGGYLEKRGIYKRSRYFNAQDTNEDRDIHLGVDMWIKANTPIFAPLNGCIHSFKNNTNHGDYGPTLILKHNISNFEFYTLYGHLSLDSITNISMGDNVLAGTQIGTLGTAEVNGDYPPHLHFQIIKDIMNYSGDYPGVTSENELLFYKRNCPDPSWLLGIDKSSKNL